MKDRTGAPCYICGEPTWIPKSKATPTTKHGACWEHGTRSGYAKHGCRCGRCLAAREERRVRYQPPPPLVSITCAQCGKPFRSRRTARRFCSEACRRLRTETSRWIAEDERAAIYERDGWTCQLCFAPVDRDAEWWSDWYPSLDHIIPRSKSRTPDHSPANLRTTHRWCNSVRGVKDDSEGPFELGA